MRFLSLGLLLIHVSATAQLNADFSAVSVQGCSPFAVQFHDNSIGSPTEWFWDFGNGITSSLQNPAVTYATRGNYTIRLIVRNSVTEDYELKTNYITVFSTPDAEFSISAGDSGCMPLQTIFKDTSDFFNASVKSRLWDFGDGSTSNQQNPAHTFIAAGKYNISLTVESSQGCSATIFKSKAVAAGNKPVANFSATPLDGCASAIRNFKNKSSGKITALAWNFGDGGISFDKNPQYHYQDTGTFPVKLMVSENGCKDSLQIQNYVHVDGPVAKFLTRYTCSDRTTINVYDKSIDETSRLWNFDDGTTSTDANVTHVYNSPGIYIISLIINGNMCSDTARDTLHIKPSTPDLKIIPAKSFYCKYDTVQFITENYDTAAVKFFYWDFGDSTLRSNVFDSITHSYKTDGNFIPTAYIRNKDNCTDTINFNSSIIIYGPNAGFSLDTTGCTNSVVKFTDTSTASGSQITQWLWSYGDGITATANGSSKYTYAFPGTYSVKLNMTDANGCVDSAIHTVNIFSSPVVDAGIDTFACAGNKIQLKATGASNYTWLNNADLSCTKCANPMATPNQSTVYYVTGTTSDGCSASDSIIVAVQTKEIISALPDSFSICESDSVGLNADGADSFTWSPANTLNSSTNKNPLAFPAATTAYTVIGKDSNNCFSDTAIVNVAVNPKPVVDIADSLVQLLKGSSYTIIASAGNDAQNFEWLPATGLSCYDCLQPVATVDKDITYTLSVTNAFGCSNTDNITIITICTAESIYLPNTFSPNNDGMNDYFFPRSSQDISIKSLTIFNRWGQMIFQKRNFSSNNSADGWDGKYKNNSQNPDVYIYLMELECSGNKTFVEKGNISLLR